MKTKNINTIIDSRHLKILSVKKSELKDSVVLLQSDENSLRNTCELLNQMEPSAIYFPLSKNLSMKIYDKSEFNNKDIVVTVSKDNSSEQHLLDLLNKALPKTKSITIIYAEEIK